MFVKGDLFWEYYVYLWIAKLRNNHWASHKVDTFITNYVFKWALVTQPMLQLRPNRTELRSMDYYHQIFCRFRKCKQKVPPPSPLSTQKLPFTPPKEDFSHPLGGVKGDFWVLRGDGGGSFCLHFRNLQKNLEVIIHRS